MWEHSSTSGASGLSLEKGLGGRSGGLGQPVSKGRTLEALRWHGALALDLLFVFLNHTAPWVRGVQPAIVQCV